MAIEANNAKLGDEFIFTEPDPEEEKKKAELLSKLFEKQIEERMAMRRQRLNEVMHAKHITLEELGKQTGVAKSSIQRYLTGETAKIPIDFFEKVANVTGVPVEYLACFEEDDDNKNTASDPRSGIGTKIDKLSDSQMDRLIGYLEALLAE